LARAGRRREAWGVQVDFARTVEDLGVPHRRRQALRALMSAGQGATVALRAGLGHPDPTVRVGCCRVLDHFLDQDAVPELVDNLAHPDAQVRAWAVHALACDNCKEGSCRPGDDVSLPHAIRMLTEGPSREVRQQAVALVGMAVHRSPTALNAVQRAHREDEHPVVRKIAGWYVPGGPRYEALKPRPPRPVGRRESKPAEAPQAL
jgi:HEAT repeat protein